MNKEAKNLAQHLIEQHEGTRYFPYQCTAGKTTIGIGRNLDDVGLSVGEVDMLFANDLDRAFEGAARFKFFEALNPARQAAIADMIFQLGLSRFRGFTKMIAALDAGDFLEAAKECLDSRYAAQTPNRALRIANIIRTGVYP